eukprot:TRINITY_DN7511_c0_g1_i2.p2 TRINITY_DN7511_c0_g1~~TRINITY_DN7511_c0_g1_i2.p2  ORF type:complete len:149 (-),score=11.24 TRINITY_DN7511_c0_g1_i2:115-561(-)
MGKVHKFTLIPGNFLLHPVASVAKFVKGWRQVKPVRTRKKRGEENYPNTEYPMGMTPKYVILLWIQIYHLMQIYGKIIPEKMPPLHPTYKFNSSTLSIIRCLIKSYPNEIKDHRYCPKKAKQEKQTNYYTKNLCNKLDQYNKSLNSAL